MMLNPQRFGDPNKGRRSRVRLVLYACVIVTMFAGSLATVYSASADESPEVKKCRTGTGDASLDIRNCTQAITAGGLSKNILFVMLDRRGSAYFTLQQYELAIEDYNTILELYPDHVQTLNSRGGAYVLLGRLDDSLLDLNRAIALDPNNANAFNSRGFANHLLERYDAAIADYDRAIALDPADATWFNNRGLTYQSMEQFDKAVADYNRAIKIDPNYVNAITNRGIAYLLSKQYNSARRDFDKSIWLDPSQQQAFNSRGMLFVMKGEFARAIVDLDMAIKLDNDNFDTIRTRGMANFFAGRYREAENDFQRMTEHNPTVSYDMIWLYMAQSRAGSDGRRRLKDNAVHADLKKWPGQIVSFLLGNISSESLVALATNDKSKQHDRSFLLYFCLGQAALIRGDNKNAIEYFQNAVDSNHEFRSGAQAELRRLKQ
jgi:lipoprotein NlpI